MVFVPAGEGKMRMPLEVICAVLIALTFRYPASPVTAAPPKVFSTADSPFSLEPNHMETSIAFTRVCDASV